MVLYSHISHKKKKRTPGRKKLNEFVGALNKDMAT